MFLEPLDRRSAATAMAMSWQMAGNCTSRSTEMFLEFSYLFILRLDYGEKFVVMLAMLMFAHTILS